jgi:hypothetical protein
LEGSPIESSLAHGAAAAHPESVADSKESNKTLWVAMAGILATAVVGLASTAAAWLSARDDRSSQRRIAEEARVYDRRVTAYLDAIDFLEGQQKSLDAYEMEVGINCTPDTHCAGVHGGPYQVFPPESLTSRLRAFGSSEAFNTFEAAENLSTRVGIVYEGETGGAVVDGALFFPNELAGTPPVVKITEDTKVNRHYRAGLQAFVAKIGRFEDLVRRELG